VMLRVRGAQELGQEPVPAMLGGVTSLLSPICRPHGSAARSRAGLRKLGHSSCAAPCCRPPSRLPGRIGTRARSSGRRAGSSSCARPVHPSCPSGAGTGHGPGRRRPTRTLSPTGEHPSSAFAEKQSPPFFRGIPEFR
jgi:hypothetical protein